MMEVQVEDQLKTLNYSGVFLSCFSDYSEKCIHSTPEHVLLYLYSGEQVIEDRNKIIKLQAGDCAFIRRDHRLKMYKNSKGEDLYKGISMTFKRNVLRDFYSKMNKSEIPNKVKVSDKTVFKLERNPAIESLFQSLTPYFDSNIQPTEGFVHLKLLEGIYALLNSNEQLYPILFDFAEPWKIDLLGFLNNNYMEELSMEQIASFTGRSLATFKRDFKKISNLTPQKWLIRKRLEMAYIQLKEDGKKVKDVYLEVGFKNPSHFSTAFKKQYGFPPTAI
ncbi:AraC family transcriptional regulator [Chryseobacterium gotjawalense]|uniref:AraC family transcriptional regulator n=1 Tax=Chryseobacterium gotjawalense TaxID=3042315 RepID=A0ABY8REY1_9FLAO|nr:MULTISPECIES: helix-turn-helix domain-containing protein [unclassified Chryseobacterium]MDQ0477293.1 AraC-like DNA-binding protein [Chryseobacterium sp. MDT2-18]WHF52526.1 AraC family transcriptional regulator [Chryseobacterium sp. wdc7]